MVCDPSIAWKRDKSMHKLLFGGGEGEVFSEIFILKQLSEKMRRYKD